MGSLLGFVLVSFVVLGAQDPSVASPDADFRTGVKLVQVSVVAQEKQGKPVADLRREEFQIFDNGSPQEIRLFSAETERSDPSAREAKVPNAFTNELASPVVSHSGYSVILIDDLFSGSDPTNEEGSSLSRVRALQTLRSIPAGEKIAIYAPGMKLRVICEFTSDRDLLERQLRKWKPTPTTPAPEPRPSLQMQMNPQMRGDAAAEAARIDELQRAAAGDFEMNAVADHLAGIPGRKNLIWLANKFSISPRALQSLVRAGISIYPVDIDGVCRLCPERPKDAMKAIAEITGGVAYYGRNDIDVAIREAMDDGRVSYTLGFYQSGDSQVDHQVHRLTVRVGRPGVTLRYRTSYTAEPPRPTSTDPVADLALALKGPIDATAIPIKASAMRVQDRLNLEATLDAGSLDLTPDRDLWKGKIQVVARFTTADGIVAGDVFSGTITLNLGQASYAADVRGGLPFQHEFKIPPKAVELKLLFANLVAGKIGTLTIPLSEVKAVN
ncbi:MAG TPA: VWA domain-containing protein [Bryobacteraceae bacterium]|jgi:VWFA-related protein